MPWLIAPAAGRASSPQPPRWLAPRRRGSWLRPRGQRSPPPRTGPPAHHVASSVCSDPTRGGGFRGEPGEPLPPVETGGHPADPPLFLAIAAPATLARRRAARVAPLVGACELSGTG